MTSCKVKINKSQLDYFRRLARNSSLEIEAYLVGEVVSPTLVTVEYFAYTKEYKSQTAGEVNWFDEDLNKLKIKAQEEKLSVVGSIHSHPNWIPILSDTDHIAHLKDQLRVLGVCGVMNRKTHVCFWVAESSLSCDIIYANRPNDSETKS